MRRIGVLLPVARNNSEYPNLVSALLEALQHLGWLVGRNLQIDIRWGGGDVEGIKKDAVELAALAPDAIVAAGATAVRLLQSTRTVPIVFVIVPDPVGAGCFVDSLARPSGNATGFTSFEYGIGGKWLELPPRRQAG